MKPGQILELASAKILNKMYTWYGLEITNVTHGGGYIVRYLFAVYTAYTQYT